MLASAENLCQRVALFDFDGVIADSRDIFLSSFSSVCREIGVNTLNTDEALLALFDGNMFEGMIAAGFTPAQLKRFSTEFAPRIIHTNQYVRPFAGMPEMLNALTSRQPVYVITSNTTACIQDFLKRHDIQGVRDVLGSDKGPSKVAKIRQVMRAYPHAKAYYIGDTKGDILEARQASAISVAVAWGWHDPQRLTSAQPDHLVHTPDQLHALLTTPLPDATP